MNDYEKYLQPIQNMVANYKEVLPQMQNAADKQPDGSPQKWIFQHRHDALAAYARALQDIIDHFDD